jgi:uncharacterized protein YcfJ
MKWRTIGIISFGLAVAACNPDSTAQRTVGGAAIGAGSGAVIGGIASGGRGAAVGAMAGGVAGALIGRASTPSNCIYRDRYGREFEARCP